MLRVILLATFHALGIITGSVTAVATYFLISLITPHLLISLPVTTVAFVAVSYTVFFAVAGINQAARPQWTAAVLALLTTAAAALVVAKPAIQWWLNPPPDYTTPEVLAALPAHTFPLATVGAGSGFADLRPLQPILQDRRIVALGEASHGTAEFFRMKHRLLEFLVCEAGYQHFGMETSPEAGHVLNEYIQGGAVVLAAELNGGERPS
jgi:hypothetical protein